MPNQIFLRKPISSLFLQIDLSIISFMIVTQDGKKIESILF